MSANFRYICLAALLTMLLPAFSTCTPTAPDTDTKSATPAGEKVIGFGQTVNLQIGRAHV